MQRSSLAQQGTGILSAIALIGPTAIGKTAIAHALAETYPVEIVSLDSGMVYRGMDIGTAKPTHCEIREYRYHGIDIADPWRPFSAADYWRTAVTACAACVSRGRIPLLVGGAMFWLRVGLGAVDDLPPTSEPIRARWAGFLHQHGVAVAHQELTRRNPKRAMELSPADRQRIQRALELEDLKLAPPAQTVTLNALLSRLHIRVIGVMPCDRAQLHRAVEARLKTMWTDGLLDEAKRLHGLLDPAVHSAARLIGYRQIWPLIDGTSTYEQWLHTSLVATRRYVKHQLTWMRSLNDASLTAEPDALAMIGAEIQRLRDRSEHIRNPDSID